MEFAFETVYNQQALTAMAKAVRKTTRAKHSKRSHIIGAVVAVLGIWLVAGDILKSTFGFKTFLNIVVVAILIAVLFFEDSVNAYFAGKRMIKGAEKANVIFSDENYLSSTEVGTTEFNYSIIQAVVLTGDYIIFVLNKNHAQAYDVTSIVNGTKEQFIAFIEQKTGKKVQEI